MLSGPSTTSVLVAARSAQSSWSCRTLKGWGQRPHLAATKSLSWRKRTKGFFGEVAGRLGRMERVSLVGIVRISWVRVRGFFWRGGVGHG